MVDSYVQMWDIKSNVKNLTHLQELRMWDIEFTAKNLSNHQN